ncbi:MAG: peptidylprolyl isomerase [bacterium]
MRVVFDLSSVRLARLCCLVLLIGGLALPGAGKADSGEEIFVRLHTDAGEILLLLQPELAPNHVANFRHLAQSGFYNGTYFHRIIPGFMIQGGDPNTLDDTFNNDGQGGPTWQDVLTPDEAEQVASVVTMLQAKGYALPDRANLVAEFNATLHVRGTLSMARTQDPNSAGSQFFICVTRTAHLDNQYTAFGRVVLGMDVADTIVNAPQRAGSGNIPLEPVRIVSVDVFGGTAGLSEPELAAWQQSQP